MGVACPLSVILLFNCANVKKHDKSENLYGSPDSSITTLSVGRNGNVSGVNHAATQGEVPSIPKFFENTI